MIHDKASFDTIPWELRKEIISLIGANRRDDMRKHKEKLMDTLNYIICEYDCLGPCDSYEIYKSCDFRMLDRSGGNFITSGVYEKYYQGYVYMQNDCMSNPYIDPMIYNTVIIGSILRKYVSIYGCSYKIALGVFLNSELKEQSEYYGMIQDFHRARRCGGKIGVY